MTFSIKEKTAILCHALSRDITVSEAKKVFIDYHDSWDYSTAELMLEIIEESIREW